MKKIMFFMFLILLLTGCELGGNAILVSDYMPQKNMIKVYSGGFEQEGFILRIDNIETDTLREIYINGTVKNKTYQLTDHQMVLIRTEILERNDLEALEDSHSQIDKFEESDETVLLSDSSSWHYNEIVRAKITSTKLSLDTSVGMLEVIEVTYKYDDTFSVKKYFAKDLGEVQETHVYGDEEVIYSKLEKVIYELESYKTYEDYHQLLE